MWGQEALIAVFIGLVPTISSMITQKFHSEKRRGLFKRFFEFEDYISLVPKDIHSAISDRTALRKTFYGDEGFLTFRNLYTLLYPFFYSNDEKERVMSRSFNWVVFDISLKISLFYTLSTFIFSWAFSNGGSLAGFQLTASGPDAVPDVYKYAVEAFLLLTVLFWLGARIMSHRIRKVGASAAALRFWYYIGVVFSFVFALLSSVMFAYAVAGDLGAKQVGIVIAIVVGFGLVAVCMGPSISGLSCMTVAVVISSLYALIFIDYDILYFKNEWLLHFSAILIIVIISYLIVVAANFLRKYLIVRMQAPSVISYILWWSFLLCAVIYISRIAVSDMQANNGDSRSALVLLLFYALLPLINAIGDFLAIGFTLYALKALVNATRAVEHILICMMNIVVCILIVLMVAFFVGLLFSIGSHEISGKMSFSMISLMADIQINPESYIWLYVPWFSALVPSITLLCLSMFLITSNLINRRKEEFIRNSSGEIDNIVSRINVSMGMLGAAAIILPVYVFLLVFKEILENIEVLGHIWREVFLWADNIVRAIYL